MAHRRGRLPRRLVRVFLDTNVLVAAFATRGLCEDVLRVVLTRHELLVDSAVVEELERVLTKKLKMNSRQARAFVEFILDSAEVIEAKSPAPFPESDPDDQWVLAAAIEGHADLLVTGDRDLLDIQDEVSIPIVTPRGFWETLIG